MCLIRFGANARSAFTMLQSAFVKSASISRYSLRKLFFLATTAFLLAFASVIPSAAQDKPSKKEDKAATESRPKSKENQKNAPATAEQVAETAIVFYAYPGGRAKLNQIRKTEIEKGKLTFADENGQLVSANYQRWIQRGDASAKLKIRFEQELPTASYSMIANEEKIFGLYNDSVFEPRPDATETFQNRYRHSIDALLWYKENGSTISLAGKDKILGVDYYLLDLTDKAGNKTRYYVSVKSFRVMMLDYEVNGIKHTRKFRDYKYAQGVLVPFYSELRAGDKLLEEIQVGTITFAQKVDDSLFSAS
jgi:hypothetical protein